MAGYVQPHRATGSRRQSRALHSMQKGHGPLRHVAEARRVASKKRRRRKKGRSRYASPLHKILRVRREL